MFSFRAAALLAILVPVACATRLHANAGCIRVNNSSVCSPNAISISSGHATIYARFDGNDHDEYAYPGCRLDASWPVNYGDIYFGDDNCLYDAQGQNILGQCCDAGTGGSQEVPNPYF